MAFWILNSSSAFFRHSWSPAQALASLGYLSRAFGHRQDETNKRLVALRVSRRDDAKSSQSPVPPLTRRATAMAVPWRRDATPAIIKRASSARDVVAGDLRHFKTLPVLAGQIMVQAV